MACPGESQTCQTPPEVKCSFHGCSSVPGKESKFALIQNTNGSMIAENASHTIVCGETNNVTEHTGVFIANIDDVDITAADMDKATNVIEDIVKNKGLIQSDNHKISNHIVMKCSGNESWTILSETFQ